MKVLMVAPCPFFLLRGKPIRVLNNTAALALLGHQVDVVTYPQGEPIGSALPESIRARVEANVRLFRIGAQSELKNTAKPGLSLKKLLSVPRLYRKACERLKADPRNRYDCLYCHDIDGALVGTRLKARFRIPLVYDMHGSFRELMANIHGSGSGRGPLAKFYEVFEGKAYRDADLVLANWPHLVPVVTRYTDAGKVRLVQDKPLLSALEQLEHGQKMTALKASLGIRHLLVYTGNFARYQRVDILLEMMRLLESRGVDADLVLAGGGFEATKAQADAMGLKRVRFVGPKYGDELYELLMNADVALSPRVTENYPPMKVITYIMAKLPTVATDLPSHRQMLTHEESGLLVEATPEAFAAAVQRLLSEPGLSAKLAARLQREAQRYTLAKLLDELGGALARLPHPAVTSPEAA